MSYYCFTKECEYYHKPAPSAYKGGYLAVGFCRCIGQNCVKVNDEACEGCGVQRSWLDNFGNNDERTETERFAGTRSELRGIIEVTYLQQRHASNGQKR